MYWLTYTAIKHVKTPRRGGDINNMLLQREAFYIFTLNALSAEGLNLEFDLKSFFVIGYILEKDKTFFLVG